MNTGSAANPSTLGARYRAWYEKLPTGVQMIGMQVWLPVVFTIAFVFCYVAAFHAPAFRDIPVAVVGPAGTVQSLAGSLAASSKGTLTTATQLVTGLSAGPLMRVMRPKTVLIIGAVPPVIGFLLLAIAHAQLWEVIVATVICGIGFGIGLSALSAVVVHAVPVTQTGAAAGMNANIRTIGGALGAAVVFTILGSHSSALGLPTETGYTAVFVTLAAAALASLIACLLIPATRAPSDPPGQPASLEAESAGPLDHDTGSAARATLATDADPL